MLSFFWILLFNMKQVTPKTLSYLVSLSIIKTLITILLVSAPWLYTYSILEDVGDNPSLISFLILPLGIISLVLLIPQLVTTYLTYKHKQYILEKDDITYSQGSFSISTLTVKYSDLRSIEFNQTWYQRMWDIGTIFFAGDEIVYHLSDVESSVFNEIREVVKPKMNQGRRM